MEYINNWGLREDLKILIRTVMIIFTGEGAEWCHNDFGFQAGVKWKRSIFYWTGSADIVMNYSVLLYCLFCCFIFRYCMLTIIEAVTAPHFLLSDGFADFFQVRALLLSIYTKLRLKIGRISEISLKLQKHLQFGQFYGKMYIRCIVVHCDFAQSARDSK